MHKSSTFARERKLSGKFCGGWGDSPCYMVLIHVKATRNSDCVTELFLWFSSVISWLFWQYSWYSSCIYFLQTLVSGLLELKCTFFFHIVEPIFKPVAKLSKNENPTFYRNRGVNAKNHAQDLKSVLSPVKTLFLQVPSNQYYEGRTESHEQQFFVK